MPTNIKVGWKVHQGHYSECRGPSVCPWVIFSGWAIFNEKDKLHTHLNRSTRVGSILTHKYQTILKEHCSGMNYAIFSPAIGD